MRRRPLILSTLGVLALALAIEIHTAFAGEAVPQPATVTVSSASEAPTCTPPCRPPVGVGVGKNGTGSGTVSSVPAGIDCGSICWHGYPSGTSVTLTATPAAGSAFTGWSGSSCTSATTTCNVVAGSGAGATATFTLLSHLPNTLSVSMDGNGYGTVSSTPAGLACPTSCVSEYPLGASVTLTAAGYNESTFTGWSGACTGTGTCNVTIGAPTGVAVTATFSVKPEFNVSKDGSGSGTVASIPAGIDCGQTCHNDYPVNTSVSLTATPAAWSTFTGWSGDCTGIGTCNLTAEGSEVDVTATFSLVPHCVVPKVKGKSLATAERRIKARDCSVGKVTHRPSQTLKEGHVIAQEPRPGKQLTQGARVNLVVSKARR